MTPNGAVREYPIPTGNAGPHTITAGADGALWFTEQVVSRIARITTDGKITEYPTPYRGMSPRGIALADDGSLWFAEYSGRKIGKITMSGEITEYLIPSGNGPTAITRGAHNDFWFGGWGGTIGRIGSDGSITEYQFPLPPNSPEVTSMTLGSDGNLWFAFGHRIGKLSPTGAFTEYKLDELYFYATIPSMVNGPDGYLWFGDCSSGAIGRMSTSGAMVEYPVTKSDDWDGYRITQGPDGNVWLTEGLSNKLGKVDISTAVPFPELHFDRESFAFACPFGVPPPPQSLRITAPVPTPLTIRASLDSQIGFLNTTPSGSINTDQTLTVTLEPLNLPVGTYPGTIYVRSQAATSLINVSVTITAATGNNVTAGRQNLDFAYTLGGNPVQSQTLTVSSLPSSRPSIPFTISAAPDSAGERNWLSLVTSAGETIAPDLIQTTSQWTFILVLVDPTGLSVGIHTATITITPVGGAVVTVPVALTIISPIDFAADPPSVNFAALEGSVASMTQSIHLRAIDDFPKGFTVVGTVPPWLKLNNRPAQTPATLSLSVSPAGLTRGTYTASIQIYPVQSDFQNPLILTIPVTLKVSAPDLDVGPTVTSVVNAASFAPGGVAPGELITIFGNGLGPAVPVGLQLDATTPDRVPTSVAGVAVTFDGHPAPLTYVSDSQINCVVPYEAVNSTASLVVTYGRQSPAFEVSVVEAAPAIFTLTGYGVGSGAIVNASGGINGPDNPAALGGFVTLFVTGEGQTQPAGRTGSVTSVNQSSTGPLTPKPVLPLMVRIAGQSALVTFFGEAPDMVAGLMQINVQIPYGLWGGDLPLLVSLGDRESQPGVTVSCVDRQSARSASGAGSRVRMKAKDQRHGEPP
jgi:virginiamycin B lyase